MVLVDKEPGTRGSGWNGLGLEWALPFDPDDKYCTAPAPPSILEYSNEVVRVRPCSEGTN